MNYQAIGFAVALSIGAAAVQAQDNPFDQPADTHAGNPFDEGATTVHNPFDDGSSVEGNNPFDNPFDNGPSHAPVNQVPPVQTQTTTANPFDNAPAIQTQTSRAAPTEAVTMQLVTLKDAGMGNMPSHTLLIPKGWTAEGGGWWANGQYFKVNPSQDIKVLAPDGRGVFISPNLAATDFRPAPHLGMPRPKEFQADNGLPVIYMPGSLEEWRVWIQDKILPQGNPTWSNIRISQITVVPELTAVLQQQLNQLRQMQAQTDAQLRAMGMNTQTIIDGAFLAAQGTYVQNGQSKELLILFATTHVGGNSEIGQSMFWGIDPCVGFVAPAGQLEASMPLLMAISYSLQMTPEWSKMKYDHLAKMSQIEAKGAADRSRIWAESNRQISKMRNETVQMQNSSNDRINEKFLKAVREVEDYSEPGSDTKVQLPSHYDYVYSNGNNEYIMTNDSLYNPNLDPLTNNRRWDTMEKLP